jgi:hypothetical protein
VAKYFGKARGGGLQRFEFDEVTMRRGPFSQQAVIT